MKGELPLALQILGMGGSPRRHGNTDRLLNQAMSTLAEAGYLTETLFIRDLKYAPCLGCNSCSKTAKCVQKDDIQFLQKKLIEADRIIIAAPIFFMGVNAQVKAIIDRMQPLWALKYVFHEPIIKNTERIPRRGLFLSVAATKFPDVFDCAERTIKSLFHVLDVEYSGACVYRGIDQPGDIENHPTAFQEIRDKVLNFVQI
jgi:hypothetical protein